MVACRHLDVVHEGLGYIPCCAFDRKGDFLRENWNCGLMNELRQLADKRAVWNNDNNAALISLGEGIEEEKSHGFLIVYDWALLTWYKRRGRTMGFWLVSENHVRQGMEKDAIKILEASKR